MQNHDYGQRPYFALFLFGLMIGFMGVAEPYERLAINVDGRISSVVTECVEPQHSRCATVYVVETPSGVKQTYIAGPTDHSLKRYLPVGTVLQKRRWKLSYQINDQEIEDFPIGFYAGCVVMSVACFILCFCLMRRK